MVSHLPGSPFRSLYLSAHHSSSVISFYHLFPLLGVGEQVESNPVSPGLDKWLCSGEGSWVSTMDTAGGSHPHPSLSPVGWALAPNGQLLGPVTHPALRLWKSHASMSGGLALLNNNLHSLPSLGRKWPVSSL